MPYDRTLPQAKRRALRQGLASGALQRVVGAFSPLVARLAEELGFEAVYCSGAAVSAALKYAGSNGAGDKLIVVIIPSYGERYIQTKLFEPYRYDGSDEISV